MPGRQITVETLYMTYLLEAIDVLKLTTPRLSPRKNQKFSGGFRGVSALESEVTESESEVTESKKTFSTVPTALTTRTRTRTQTQMGELD
jgi:hypothetical protein